MFFDIIVVPRYQDLTDPRGLNLKCGEHIWAHPFTRHGTDDSTSLSYSVLV